jgi:hypothetical protein
VVKSLQAAREADVASVVRVADRPDAADFAIAARCRSGDIVVTDDVGLASIAASKGARAVSSRGRVFRPEDIPLLLEERHRSRKARRAGRRPPDRSRGRASPAMTVIEPPPFPQASSLRESMGGPRSPYDTLGRYERLEEDLNAALVKAGVAGGGVRVPHTNVTPNKDSERSYRSYYSDRTRDRVADWYAPEIALLDYAF